MITYRIGALAETLVAVKIDLAGSFEPYVRRRQSNGRFAAAPGFALERTASAMPVDFVARLSPGHAGVVEIAPMSDRFALARTVIPLGPEHPFIESELPPSPGADGAFSFSDELRFHYADRTLSWISENMSGRVVLTDSCPALTVTMRLAPGNDGALVFSSSLFPHADGRARCTISAA